MTRIEAVIAPGRLEAVQRALEHPWIGGLTVTEVKGAAGAPAARYRGVAAPPVLSPLLRVEVVVPSHLVPRLLHDLMVALRAGRPGDDLLVAAPVDEAVRLRTGERGEGAL